MRAVVKALVGLVLASGFWSEKVLSAGGDSALAEAPPEVRGVWLKPENTDTPSKRAGLYRKIETANLNTVFLAAWGDMNAFREFVRECNRRRWAVHGWICNHYRTDNVDWTDAEEWKAQRDWALGIMDEYPTLDGMHFDYIRTKGWESCSKAKIDGITATIRMTSEAIKKKHEGKFLTAAVFTAATLNYLGWRQGQNIKWDGDVPDWYREWWSGSADNWYTANARLRPDLNQNAVLGPLHFHFQQDPVTWLRSGALDAVMPMQYSMHDKSWHDEADIWRVFLGDRTPEKVLMGIGWWSDTGPQRSEEQQGYDSAHAAALVRHIKYGRSRGYRGFVIFSFGYVPEKDWLFVNALSKDSAINEHAAPFRHPAPSPLLSTGVKKPARAPARWDSRRSGMPGDNRAEITGRSRVLQEGQP